MCEKCEMGKGEGKCEHCGGMHGGRWGGKWMMMKHHGGKSGGLYGIAFLGAAFYYIGQATTFWMGVVGFGKALVWPAMLIYKAFTLLGM